MSDNDTEGYDNATMSFKMSDNDTEVYDNETMSFKMNDDDSKIPAVETPKKGNSALDNEATMIRCSPRLNNGKTVKELFHDNTSVSQEGKPLLHPKMMFETSAELNSYMLNYAKQNGFLISKAHTYYDCDSEAKREATSKRFPLGSFCVKTGKDGRDKGPLQRGRFMCNAAKAQCNWSVHFTHAKIPGNHGDFSYKYIIKPEGFNLTHTSHRMLGIPLNDECVQTYNVVFSEQQLDAEEFQFLCDQALYTGDSAGKIRINMQRKFPDRTYSTDLIKRMVNKYCDDYYGKGRDQINELMRRGEAEKQRGGAFETSIDGTLRLKGFILQTKEMREYSLLYNDFVILDGTHGTNRYGLILEPPTLVDCLGRSVIAGIPICESEENEFSGRILQTLGLVREDGVLMTDEGSAFIGLAERLGMQHVLCSFHFQNKTKQIGGLGDYKPRFQKRFNDLIYQDYQTSECFDAAYRSFEKSVTEKYPDAKDAIRLVAGLYKVRHKVCCTFTKEFFTCGHTSTGRGEATNSSIKVRGELKKEMKGFGLFQLVEHVIALFQRRQSEALTELIRKIEHPKIECSDYVHNIWLQNIIAANQFSNAILDETASQFDFECWTVTSQDKVVSTVKIHIDGQHPTCTCGMYRSTLIPCPCICAIYQRKGLDFFKAKDLHRRWRLDHHPLWKVAHRSLHIELPIYIDQTVDKNVAPSDVAPSDEITNTSIPRNVFDTIKCPKTSHARYAQLKVAFDEIVSYAQDNPLLFRHALAFLLQEATYCRERNSGNFDKTSDVSSALVKDQYNNSNAAATENLNPVQHLLPPRSKLQRKRARLTNNDVTNCSRLKNKKSK